jgi:hypothetical protein|tara:strand:+ start:304 stop:1152 length:849 start_codon:yes stop_codon:yes gene_type:complete
MPTHKDSQNITKRIYLSEENFEKLKKLGVGSNNDKLSTLLDKHEQTLIDQSKPSAATSTEPLTDYLLGLIIRHYFSLGNTIYEETQKAKLLEDQDKELEDYQINSLKETLEKIDRGEGGFGEVGFYTREGIEEQIRKIETKLLEDQDKEELEAQLELINDVEKNQSRATLKNSIWKTTKDNGWHNEYPTFFESHTKKDSRYLRKLDKCLELLVRNEVLTRTEIGYRLNVIPEDQDEIEKLSALRYQTVTDAPPTIYYKRNQKRKTFSNGQEVPSIDIYKARK